MRVLSRDGINVLDDIESQWSIEDSWEWVGGAGGLAVRGQDGDSWSGSHLEGIDDLSVVESSVVVAALKCRSQRRKTS